MSGEEYAEAKPVSPDGNVSDAAPPGVRRRIIYTAEVELTVERLAEGETAFTRLVKDHGGYLASSNIAGQPGQSRTGTWKARIPVAQYERFMQALTRMGEVQRVTSDSQDVTADYYDAKARLGNKRVEEQRLLAHLRASTGKLSEILAVEKELSRVREEIERIEGQLRLLTNQTELTTITVTLHERQGYVPPRKAGFGTEVSRTFQDSMGALADTGRLLALMLVAMVPWLVVIAVLGVPLLLLLRAGLRKSQAATAAPRSHPTR